MPNKIRYKSQLTRAFFGVQMTRSETRFREPPMLDTTDLKILEQLQTDAKTPQAAIAERVGLSTPAVNERKGENASWSPHRPRGARDPDVGPAPSILYQNATKI